MSMEALLTSTDEDLKQICCMQGQWQRILKEEEVSILEHWRSSLAQMENEQRELADQGKWLLRPADLLSIIGRSRRETFHCAILAWLMDPKAPHGFGATFLKKVLVLCFPDDSFVERELLDARTRCEVVRPNSRAGILVEAGQLTVVFEAKVDHHEGSGM